MTRTNSTVSNMCKRPRIAFFGTPVFAVHVAQRLAERGIIPDLIVTQPNRPSGRGYKSTPPPLAEWASHSGIETVQPASLRDTLPSSLTAKPFDVFIVAAYGMIIPDNVLSLPRRGAFNIHPSLLPRHRGAAPLHSALLEDEETGVTIIEMDEKMDHGPIVAREKTRTPQWPLPIEELAEITAKQGADMVADVLPQILDGSAKRYQQDHHHATYTRKIKKEDAQIRLNDPPLINYRKYCAYHEWPRVFFYALAPNDKRVRVVVTDAAYHHGAFEIKRVVPEGKKEMPYNAFIRAYRPLAE